MPETIDLLLKELKLPAFIRHYLGNCSCITHMEVGNAGGRAMQEQISAHAAERHQEQAIEQGYSHVRYLSGLYQ